MEKVSFSKYYPVPISGLWGPWKGAQLKLNLSFILCIILSVFLGIGTIVLEWSGIPFSLLGVESHISIYPPLILSTFFALCFGFWWGFIPAYLSTFAIGLYTGMPVGWCIMFALANPLSLLVLCLAYSISPFSFLLKNTYSVFFYFGICLFAALLGSSGSFIFTNFNNFGLHDSYAIWQGWWVGNFLQTLVINGAIFYFFGEWVLKWKYTFLENPEEVNPPHWYFWMHYGIIFLISSAFCYTGGSVLLGNLEGMISEYSSPEILTQISEIKSLFLLIICLVGVLILFSFLMNREAQSRFREKLHAEKKERETAQQVSNLKSSFLAHISHELRTPLTAILGFSEKPEKDSPSSHIHQAGENMLRIVDNILILTELEAGKLMLELRPHSFSSFIKEILAEHEELAKNKNLTFAVTFDDKNDARYIFDQARVSIILKNLLFNAVQYTTEGGIEVSIEKIKEEKGVSHLSFHIKDTGIGIKEEKISEIFSPFVQGEKATKRNHGGMGLGLTIVKKLIDLMGGELWIESEENNGSFIGFSLPLQNFVGDSPKEKEVDFGDVLKEGIRILAVEDAPLNKLLLKQIFSSHNCSVEYVENGKEALSILEESEFDIILLDLHMPVMNGYEFLEFLNNGHPIRWKDTPIIILTADLGQDNRTKLRRFGCESFISKPYKKKDLFRAINQYVPPSK